MQTGTENTAPDIKKLLPRGFGPIIAKRAKKSIPYVYDVLNGKKFNAAVLSEAVKMAKDEAKTQAALEKEISSLVAVA